MGQMDLAELRGLGEAAARLARCFQSETWDDLLSDVAVPFEALVASQGDSRKISMPRSLFLAHGMHTEGVDHWHAQVWTAEEASRLACGAGWCFTAGRRQGYEDQSEEFYERVSQLGLNPTGHYIELAIRTPPSDDDLVPISIRLSGSRHETSLHRLLGSSESGLRRAERRELLQSMDALTRGPDVSVDLTWSPEKVRDSVMAQIAGWYVRVEGRTYAESQPTLTEDAYNWLMHYAVRVARRRLSDVTVSDVHAVARRSVRPPSAAAHHLYWTKSLAHGPEDDLATRAAAIADVSRRTLFNRLKKANKTLADFSAKPDAASALQSWLSESEPTGRLAPDRREVIKVLVEGGMRPEAARKLERRVRGLALDEQQRRLYRAVGRKL